jgi:hypothetical protein
VCQADFKRYEMQDFLRYASIIDVFRTSYGLSQFTLKELDNFLWLYGKSTR